MNTSVQELTQWFDKLPAAEKEAVLKFLYGKILIRKDQYVGPVPEVIGSNEGLSYIAGDVYVGPAPPQGPADTDTCPACGKKY